MNAEEFEKLTSSQKAVIALKVEERLAEEARVRRLAGLKQNRQAESLRNEVSNGSGGPLDTQVSNGNCKPLDTSFLRSKAAVQAASIAGTNRKYVTYAKKIGRQAPELLKSVLAGHITIPDAKRIAAEATTSRNAEGLPTSPNAGRPDINQQSNQLAEAIDIDH